MKKFYLFLATLMAVACVEKPVASTIEASPSSVDITAEGGEFEVVVKSDSKFDVSEKTSWIEQKTWNVSAGVSTYLYKVGETDSSEPREGIIRYTTTDGVTAEVHVTQAGASDEAVWLDKVFAHRSLLMRFTATWCGYCPMMNEAAEKAMAANPGKIEYVALHDGSSDLPTPGVNKLENTFSVQGFPTGIVDCRAEVPNHNSTDVTASVFSALVKEAAVVPSATGIKISSKIEGGKIIADNFVITENPNKKEELEKLTYSVIYNLQLTFMNLKYGSMSPYPPKRFIKSFLTMTFLFFSCSKFSSFISFINLLG